MALQLLLDTSFCLYLITHKPAGLAQALSHFRPGELGVSSLTVAALEARVQHSRDPERNRQALAQFLLPLVEVDFDGNTARALGQISARWDRLTAHTDGHSLLLAAHALHLDVTLLSRRPEMYPALPGLRCNTGDAAPFLEILTRHLQEGDAPPPLLPAGLEPPADGAATLVVMGSHDLSLDLLADAFHREHPGTTVVSAHIGSTAGLLALRRHQAHLAGVHLFDPESGEFNIAHIRRLLVPYGCRVVVLGFVTRTQGLMVAPGNPKGIASLADLSRDDVRLVNRQPGAGTRLWLDDALERRGLDPQGIQGYDRWVTSHALVAAAVDRGDADCGLGIFAAAHGHHLDFIPLFEERYDLVIARHAFEGELLRPFVELVQNPPAQLLTEIARLGGYGTAGMGQVIARL